MPVSAQMRSSNRKRPFLSMAWTNSMRVGPIKEAKPPVPGLDGTRITRR